VEPAFGIAATEPTRRTLLTTLLSLRSVLPPAHMMTCGSYARCDSWFGVRATGHHGTAKPQHSFQTAAFF